MRLCIVGNGPTAASKGDLIDSADFVARIKAWWAHAAADSGTRCDATAWYGECFGWNEKPKGLALNTGLRTRMAWSRAGSG